MSDPTIAQKLEDIRRALFDHNYYEIMTIHGWQETQLISVTIGGSIKMEVVNPDYLKWLASDKQGAQPASLVLYGIDDISRYLRKSWKENG
jgi:hypothetical protein